MISLLTALCVGCASTPAKVNIAKAPWDGNYRYLRAEHCEYDVTKYVGDRTESVASGKMTYDISKQGSYYTLVMDFYITYGDSDSLEEAYKGVTDRINSTSKFRTDDLTAVSTEKNVVLQSYPENSYSYVIDYENNTSLYTDYDGKEKTLKFGKGEYFDNEYMFYYVRSLQKLSDSFTETINIVNWYDCFNAGKFKATSMIVNCSNRSEAVKLDDDLFAGFVANEDNTGKDDENKTVSCYDVSISINGIKTGPELHAMFSKCGFATPYVANGEDGVNTTKLVPVKYVTRETISSGYTTFYTDYVLSDFSCTIEPPSSN